MHCLKQSQCIYIGWVGVVYVFIYAVLKYWMVLVLMGYDYVEPCTGQYNYSKPERRLNTTTKRNADLWLSPRRGLS